MSGNSYASQWTFHSYSVDHARWLYPSYGAAPYETFQLESCFLGGGTSWNGWKQYFDGASVTMARDRIGCKWAQGTSGGNASATLTFQVNTGAVKIGASIPITPDAGSNGGSLGKSSVQPGYPYSSSMDVNRVNAYWSSNHNTIFDGTEKFVGNIGHSLWEMPRTSATSTTYAYISGGYFCGVAFGLCFSSLN